MTQANHVQTQLALDQLDGRLKQCRNTIQTKLQIYHL